MEARVKDFEASRDARRRNVRCSLSATAVPGMSDQRGVGLTFLLQPLLQTQSALERSWKNKLSQEAIVHKVGETGPPEGERMPRIDDIHLSVHTGHGEVQERLHPHQQLQRAAQSYARQRPRQGDCQVGQGTADCSSQRRRVQAVLQSPQGYAHQMGGRVEGMV